ncbi:protein kinase family protein [Streptomyces sp. NBC_00249]|uniref:protein kinase family protein n=1 Tax=Streptomyces sp. NBC_00249 TaxID=2975690 RepID=UPI00225510F5|nr:protein kinase family protein [Streptomyces sp. NBC_00249]MCX5194857.1 protein kinase family protein [Streptomyces sp. NBC_00249]
MHSDRLTDHLTVSTALSLLSDHRLAGTVAAATPLGAGIGGRSGELDVGGTRVFVKRVPVTDAELLPRTLRSTANVFGLPLFYQYGVGSAGFGAWRELAAHVTTTHWALGGAYDGFPLLYHWRLLPDSPPAGFVDGFGGIDGAVAHWEGSAAVRRRLEAIGEASYSLVLFLEYVPHRLSDWLAGRRDPVAEFPWVAQALTRGAEFMRSRGMVHFDAHFHNVLTDGRMLYFADFGLALSEGFDLAPQEREFLSAHLGYDRAYTAAHLLRYHLPAAARGGLEHEALLRAWVAGRRPGSVPAGAAGVLDRHAGASAVLDEFHRRLVEESKRTPYPAGALARHEQP